MGFKLTTKLIIAAVVLIILIILGLSNGIFNFDIVKTTSESNQQLVLKKIEEVGNLELVKFNFNDIIEESVVRRIFDIDNLAPNSRVLVIVNGEATACINLKKVTKNDIKIIGDNVNISLPEPMICYTKSITRDQEFMTKILRQKYLIQN